MIVVTGAVGRGSGMTDASRPSAFTENGRGEKT
jgi:hypothetical protein